MSLTTIRCPYCHSSEYKQHSTYQIKSGEIRSIYTCEACKKRFSETKNTPLERMKTSLDTVATVMKGLNDGLSINAASRVFSVGKNSIQRWLGKMSNLKETLFLYSICHQFTSQFIEGDELYTKVNENKPAHESEGWTIVLMERATRFIWAFECGKKDRELFFNAMNIIAQLIENTEELTVATDGERRYGNMLFEVCNEVICTGKPGRPPTTLKKNVAVRLKNKGSQAHKKGPKLNKYEAPQNEHPDTTIVVEDKDIHANHVEAFNSALRRCLSCYRRKTNTYTKNGSRLQKRLNAHWIFHNFVVKHFTTKEVPAVAQKILVQGFTFGELFRIQFSEKIAV